jgi:hypothetical protein
MGSERWFCNAFGGTGKIFKTIAAAALIVLFTAATSRAGDISSQPADSLAVTNSVTRLLPQAAPLPPEPPPPPPPGPGEASWLQRFHLSGYLSEQAGVYQDPPGLSSLTRSRNNLAVARTTLQADENFQLDEHNSFFMREWFTYDPPYYWNSANNPLYSRPPDVIPPHLTGASVGPQSYGHYTNDALNQYSVRDAWWETKWGPLTLFTGNQIVVWGQSATFRVGDIVNPSDNAWAFGFANLEQSRKPQWMVHPLFSLPDWGSMTSNFLEVIWMPGWSPQWWSCSYGDGRYNGYSTKCGRMLTGQNSLNASPLMRFESDTPQNVYYPFTMATAGYNINGPFNKGATINGQPTGVGGNNILGGPGLKARWFCNPGPNAGKGRNLTAILDAHVGVVNFADPAPLSLRRSSCNMFLNKGEVNYGALGEGAFLDIEKFNIRGYSPQFWNEGVRFHTLLGPAELTNFVFYDNTNQGAQANVIWHPYTNLATYDPPAEVIMGVTGDMPLPLPASLAEHFPAVGRAEMTYINHKSVDDMRPYTLTTRAFTDYVNWMAAIDLTNAYAPWLTKTGDLTANFEAFDSIAMDISKYTEMNNRQTVHIIKNPLQLFGSLTTSWYYSDFVVATPVIFAPKGTTFLMFPSLTLNPPWTKKYFMRLQAIEIVSSDRMAGQVGGAFKGQSFLNALLQYNFDIL